MRKIVLVCVAALGSLAVSAQPSFKVEVPSVVAVDEAFEVVYTANERVESFVQPKFEHFDVLTGPVPGQMSRTNIINGKRTQSFEMTYSYVLQAREEGVFDIPQASVVIDGQTYSSQVQQVKVVKSQRPAATAASTAQSPQSSQSSEGIADEDLFLKVELSRRNVVVGEPLIVTVKLYTRRQVTGFEDARFLTFNGFWSDEFDSPSNVSFSREELDGVIYDAAILRRYMLIPQRTGNLTITPAELVCLVPVRAQNRRSNSIFDDFFDSGYRTVRKRLMTDPITLHVGDLPSGAPATFGGGVGHFQLEAALSQTQVKAHEAVSLMITVRGTGNINLIQAPKYELHPDFEVYDMKRTEDFKVGQAGPSGTRTFEVPFIPRSPGTYTIDPVRMSYYDTQSKRYVELSTPAMTLQVEAGESQSAVVTGGVNRQVVKNLGEDIRFIVTDAAGLEPKTKVFCGSLAFWLIPLGLLLLTALSVFVLDKRLERKQDIIGTRNRQANKVARTRLKLANTFLTQQLHTAFYEELHKALVGYLSDKLMLPMSELNRDRIAEVLTQRGADETLINRLTAVLDACEYARYAPQSDTAQMQQQYEDAVAVISLVESL